MATGDQTEGAGEPVIRKEMHQRPKGREYSELLPGGALRPRSPAPAAAAHAPEKLPLTAGLGEQVFICHGQQQVSGAETFLEQCALTRKPTLTSVASIWVDKELAQDVCLGVKYVLCLRF